MRSKAYNEIHREEDHNSDSGDDFHGFESIREDVINGNGQGEAEGRRLAGRPNTIRTGNPGRPRKNFNKTRAGVALEEHLEHANLAEIPLKEALGGSEGEDWKRAIMKNFKH